MKTSLSWGFASYPENFRIFFSDFFFWGFRKFYQKILSTTLLYLYVFFSKYGTFPAHFVWLPDLITVPFVPACTLASTKCTTKCSGYITRVAEAKFWKCQIEVGLLHFNLWDTMTHPTIHGTAVGFSFDRNRI